MKLKQEVGNKSKKKKDIGKAAGAAASQRRNLLVEQPSLTSTLRNMKP